MFTPNAVHRLTAIAALTTVGLVSAPGVGAAPPTDGSDQPTPTIEWSVPTEYATPWSQCQAGDATRFAASLSTTGELTLSYEADGVATCNEWVVVQTWPSDGVTIDMHSTPPLATWTTDMATLENAGPAGLTTTMAMDPCSTALTVLRDGDTRVLDDIVGDGCDEQPTAGRSLLGRAVGERDLEVEFVLTTNDRHDDRVTRLLVADRRDQAG